MKIYLETATRHLAELIETIHFNMVLVDRGHLSERTGVWMPYRKSGDPTNENVFETMDRRFDYAFSERGIEPMKGILFPEHLLWEQQYDDLIIFGTAEDLYSMIDRLSVFAGEKNLVFTEKPEEFLYSMECTVQAVTDPEGRNDRRLFVTDRGYLYPVS